MGLKMVQFNFPLSSCDNRVEILRCMFPSPSAVPDQFSLGRIKATYLLTEALFPYFKGQIIENIKTSNLTILFDETVNKAGRKELDFAVRYWSKSPVDSGFC